ncbi:hypothetical protein [Mycobacterium sp.]|uniref:hypothetical protein n=2 Tax=Mycobacterium sp. TaxID=1785 RepID=UPI0031DAB940
MHRRIWLTSLAGGGLCATALLQAAAAAATGPSDTGADAFTIGGFTFDPFIDTGCSYCAEDGLAPTGTETEGFTTFSALVGAPPLLNIGGGAIPGIPLAPQYLEVYNASGTELGSIDVNEAVVQVLGQTSYEFTVRSVVAASGETTANLPAVGTVYDVFNVLNLYENVYVATPGSSGTVTEFLVTPAGQFNLDSPVAVPGIGTLDLTALLGINDAQPLQPGDAFTGLQAGDSAIGADAFTIGGFTLDPTVSSAEGYSAATALAGFPPLLNIAGADVNGSDLISQDFTVYSGTTDVGSITTNEEVTSLLGLTNTQLTVTGVTPASGETTADLPATGTVYDVFNLSGLDAFGVKENIYIATPGGTVTDTLVTSSGNIDLGPFFNAADPLDAGAALAPLQAGDSAIGADAFTIDGLTFNPETALGVDVFNPVSQTIGAPPLLSIGGGQGGGLTFAPQVFYVYSGAGSSATELGRIDSAETVTYLGSLTNTEFVSTGCYGGTCLAGVPVSGTVYDVFNFGGGFENVYVATPGGTVTDTFLTPYGPLIDFTIPDINAALALDPIAAIPLGFDVPF